MIETSVKRSGLHRTEVPLAQKLLLNMLIEFKIMMMYQ